MNNKSELLPCAHCGSMKIVEGNYGDDVMYLECLECGATGPADLNRAKMIAAWNRRDLADPTDSALLAALQSLIGATSVEAYGAATHAARAAIAKATGAA